MFFLKREQGRSSGHALLLCSSTSATDTRIFLAIMRGVSFSLHTYTYVCCTGVPRGACVRRRACVPPSSCACSGRKFRQKTSAYVSARQRTSAYVSIPARPLLQLMLLLQLLRPLLTEATPYPDLLPQRLTPPPRRRTTCAIMQQVHVLCH